MRILKTKWYLAEKNEGQRGYTVLSKGPFRTESKAFQSMYRTAATQDPSRPSQLLQERKPEWENRRVITVKGARILELPRIYQVSD